MSTHFQGAMFDDRIWFYFRKKAFIAKEFVENCVALGLGEDEQSMEAMPQCSIHEVTNKTLRKLGASIDECKCLLGTTKDALNEFSIAKFYSRIMKRATISTNYWLSRSINRDIIWCFGAVRISNLFFQVPLLRRYRPATWRHHTWYHRLPVSTLIQRFLSWKWRCKPLVFVSFSLFLGSQRVDDSLSEIR